MMATVEQLVKQYETDKALQAEVAAIVADGKVSMMEFLAFAKKHDVAISLEDLPKYLEQASPADFVDPQPSGVLAGDSGQSYTTCETAEGRAQGSEIP